MRNASRKMKILLGFLSLLSTLSLQSACSPGIISVVNEDSRLPPPPQAPSFENNRRFDDTVQKKERYGTSFAAGHFTRLFPIGHKQDLELAVGIPGSEGTNGNKNVGSVIMYVKDANGQETDSPILLTPERLHFQEPKDLQFGFALASGDFDGNNVDDLAIGCPGWGEGAGVVLVSYGPDHESGFSFLTNLNSPAGWRRFGHSLAAADFNGDGFDDLVVGEPGANVIAAEPATVWVFFGNNPADGRLNNNDRTEIPLPFPDRQQNDTVYGWSLAVGNFVSGLDASNIQPLPDLAIGAPLFNVVQGGDTQADVGKVYVFRPTGGRDFELALSLIPNGNWTSYARLFGFSLSAGNYNDDSSNGAEHTDLSIGAPKSSIPEHDGIGETGVEPFGDAHTPGAGLVFLAPHVGNMLDIELRVLSQDRMGISQKQDNFGWALASGDFNRDGTDDLAIGSPNEKLWDFNFTNPKKGGAIYFRFGQSGDWSEGAGGGIPSVPVACFDYIDSVRSGEFSSKGDRFGSVLLTTFVNDDPFADLLVGAPETDFLEDQNHIKDAGAIWIGLNETSEPGPFNGLFQGNVNDDNGPVLLTLNIHDREGAICGTLNSGNQNLNFDDFDVDPICLNVSTIHDNSPRIELSHYIVQNEDEERIGFLNMNLEALDVNMDAQTETVILETNFKSSEGDKVDRLVTADRVGDPTVDPDCND